MKQFNNLLNFLLKKFTSFFKTTFLLKLFILMTATTFINCTDILSLLRENIEPAKLTYVSFKEKESDQYDPNVQMGDLINIYFKSDKNITVNSVSFIIDETRYTTTTEPVYDPENQLFKATLNTDGIDTRAKRLIEDIDFSYVSFLIEGIKNSEGVSSPDVSETTDGTYAIIYVDNTPNISVSIKSCWKSIDGTTAGISFEDVCEISDDPVTSNPSLAGPDNIIALKFCKVGDTSDWNTAEVTILNNVNVISIDENNCFFATYVVQEEHSPGEVNFGINIFDEDSNEVENVEESTDGSSVTIVLSDWNCTGDAFCHPDGSIDLTDTSQGQKSALYSDISLTDSKKVYIDMKIKTGHNNRTDNQTGADGFAVTFVNDLGDLNDMDDYTSMVKNGGKMGYGGLLGDDYIEGFKAMHIEFDTYINDYDPECPDENCESSNPDGNMDTRNHIAITKDGNHKIHHNYQEIGNFEDDQWHTIHIEIEQNDLDTDNYNLLIKMDGILKMNTTINKDYIDFSKVSYIMVSAATGGLDFENYHLIKYLVVYHQ